LAEAKLRINNNSQVQITERLRRYLGLANLINIWNNRNFIRTYLEFFQGPDNVQAELESITCIGGETNITEKRNFLTKLLNTYLIETDLERRSEYTRFFLVFVNNEQCINRAERAKWLRRWDSN